MNATQEYKARIKHDIGSALSYTQRKTGKHRQEMALIEKGLRSLDDSVRTVLDIPCGVGRASIYLAERGFEVTGADLGQGAVDVARKQVREAGSSATIEPNDIESMSYDTDAFDAILCFRLYHHFPDEGIRARVIRELCRVADRYVLISYLSPASYTSIRRKLAHRLRGKRSKQNVTSLASIERHFADNGFELVKDHAQLFFLHSLHLAVFRKKS